MNPPKAKVGIVTDSTADLPPEIAARDRIAVVPAYLMLEGKSHPDGEGISRSEFYARLPGFERPPTTAAPSPVAFSRVYERLFHAGYERILSLHVAKELSGMLNSASQAAQAFGGRVHLFDSGQVSLGLGFQVMEAAEAALSGARFGQVLAAASEARKRARVIALVDTLEYLRRSGRVGWLSAGVADLLHVRVVLSVMDGLVEAIAKARTASKALAALLAAATSWGPLKRVAVLHSGAPERAENVSQLLRGITPLTPLIVNATTVIGTHIGPGAVGLAGLMR